MINQSKLTGAIGIVLTVFGASSSSASDWETVGGIYAHGSGINFVYIPPKQIKNEQIYNDAITNICKYGTWCKILFWADKDSIPKRLPMTDAQLKKLVADYVFNPATSHRSMRYDCKIMPNAEYGDCMAK